MRALHHSLLWSALMFLPVTVGLAQEGANEPGPRAVKFQIQPVYPDIARRMNITGAVQLEAIVKPDGKVKGVHITGGHPLLAEAASRAVMGWRYQPSDHETIEHIKIDFGN